MPMATIASSIAWLSSIVFLLCSSFTTFSFSSSCSFVSLLLPFFSFFFIDCITLGIDWVLRIVLILRTLLPLPRPLPFLLLPGRFFKLFDFEARKRSACFCCSIRAASSFSARVIFFEFFFLIKLLILFFFFWWFLNMFVSLPPLVLLFAWSAATEPRAWRLTTGLTIGAAFAAINFLFANGFMLLWFRIFFKQNWSRRKSARRVS